MAATHKTLSGGQYAKQPLPRKAVVTMLIVARGGESSVDAWYFLPLESAGSPRLRFIPKPSFCSCRLGLRSTATSVACSYETPRHCAGVLAPLAGGNAGRKRGFVSIDTLYKAPASSGHLRADIIAVVSAGDASAG